MSEPDDDFTELVDPNIKRVDLVGKAANGTRILFAKSAGGEPTGLFEADFVREMIAKADPSDAPAQATDSVTVSGSPAAVADMMARAYAGAVRKSADGGRRAEYVGFVKAKYSAEDKHKLAAQGHAMHNGDGEPDYPIDDAEDLGKAIHAVGRGGADHDKIRAYVIRRAQAMGSADQIPENWASDGSLKQPVSKADDDEPGSPAWEAQDADSAEQVLAAILALRPRVQALAIREGTEVGAGHIEDLCDVFDLQGAQDCLMQAAKLLGGFAVSERAEAGDAVAKTADALTISTAASAAPSPQESTVTDTQAAPATAAAPASAPAETVAKSDGALSEAELAAIGRDYLRKMAAETAAQTTGAVAPAESARVIPGTETVQAPAEVPDDSVTKAAQLVATVFGEAMAPVTKQLGELVAKVESQHERVEKALAKPDDRRSPLLNGSTGTPTLAQRGPTTTPEFAAITKAINALPEGPARDEAKRAVAFAAIEARFSPS
jgi:hypothetical protein